jgi:hypothetical protein
MLSGCALVGNIAIEILVLMEDTSGRSRDFGRESLYVVPGKIPIAVIVHGMRLPFDERYDLQIETGVARRGVALRVFYTHRVCDLKMCTTDLPCHNRDAPGAGHAV